MSHHGLMDEQNKVQTLETLFGDADGYRVCKWDEELEAYVPVEGAGN
jgi:hypothetical protein